MGTHPEKAGHDRSGTERIDKWLWFSRITKSRSLAAKLVEGGFVRINRAKITKPAYTIRPGDVITASLPDRVMVLRVTALGDRRGPATEARTLYADITPRDADDGVSAEAPRAALPEGGEIARNARPGMALSIGRDRAKARK